MQNSVSRPTRAILNFSHRCALSCEWCYVPFETPAAQRETVLGIVDRLVVCGFSHLTLGGGDPFQYSFIGDVAKKAHSCGLFVHVDTHGKSLTPTALNTNLVTAWLGLVGLPLDGPTAVIHDTMRSASGHFDLVIRRSKWLASIGQDVKINTMVSAQNSDSLTALADFIVELSPSRWSLYQFWPLGPAEKVLQKHSISDASFQSIAVDAASRVKSKSNITVEIVGKKNRIATYPVIHHDGSVFVISNKDPNILARVCSVFDSDAREVISGACGPERVQSATRYISVRTNSS